ncbi:hypothetical protein LCGC14_1999850 [marine sediment metagenome]|uniref:Uncharacterized protein n=1 Tax=marine sediment metagenome TaxID=412755 RepID=A0A0F9FRE0_9ZZZZ
MDTSDWFMSLDDEDNIAITHWCKGVETKEEVIEYAKKGMVGQLKPKGTNNEGTLWFNPAPEIEDIEHESFGRYQCRACHHITDDTTKFTQMGDDT